MRVSFAHDPGRPGGSVATVTRADGVSLELRSYDRKYRVPHDLAHFVAEQEFRLDRGVWGSIAAGAVFASMTVVAGRPRHDSGQRSRDVLRANRTEINLAECVAGAVHAEVDPAAPGGRRPTGGRQPAAGELPLAAATQVRAAWQLYRAGVPLPPELPSWAVNRLRELGTRWQQLGAGERIDLDWTLPVVRLAAAKHPRR